LPRLEKLIGELDVLPTQVMVEAKIIEVDLGNGANAGLDVNYKKNNSNDNVQTLNLAGRPTDATVPGLNTSTAQGVYAHVLSIFSTASLEAFLSALSTSNKTNVVAAPKITTLNNKEASILIGAKFGYKTSVISQTSTTQVVNFLEVGTSLTMTPNVTKNGYIRMKVAPKVSDGIVVNDLPQENTTETKNEVMVKDGQTFVIGGLVKQKDTTFDYGVPFLMDIPILGALFRKSVTNSSKTELLIFVTPHILTAEYLDSIDLPTKEFVEKNERYKARLIH
jgi:type II secretory pathway component GspD/PulD (secretin)